MARGITSFRICRDRLIQAGAALLLALWLGQALVDAAHAHDASDPALNECAICHHAGQGDEALPADPPGAAHSPVWRGVAVAPAAFDRIVSTATRAASARGPPLR